MKTPPDNISQSSVGGVSQELLKKPQGSLEPPKVLLISKTKRWAGAVQQHCSSVKSEWLHLPSMGNSLISQH